MKQLPLRVPKGLLELEIMTEEARREEGYPGVQGMGVRHVKSLGAPEGLLELEIMPEKIGMRKNGVLGM